MMQTDPIEPDAELSPLLRSQLRTGSVELRQGGSSARLRPISRSIETANPSKGREPDRCRPDALRHERRNPGWWIHHERLGVESGSARVGISITRFQPTSVTDVPLAQVDNPIGPHGGQLGCGMDPGTATRKCDPFISSAANPGAGKGREEGLQCPRQASAVHMGRRRDREAPGGEHLYQG